MTEDQITKMQELVWAVQRLVSEASSKRLPHELSVCICRADDCQSAVYQFITSLEPR